MPFGGQGGQFPDGVAVARPAAPKLVAAVLPTEHSIDPLPQLGELRRIRLAVQADPERSSRATGCGGVQRAGDRLGEFLEAAGEIQIAAEPGAVEAFADQRYLPAQGGNLYGQRGQALTERLHGRLSLRAGHHPPRSATGGRPDR